MGVLDSNRLIRLPQAVTSDVLTIAGAASVSTSASLIGKSMLRLTIGSIWTAASITVQVSDDNTTWYDLYDEYGNVYVIAAAASRTIVLTSGMLIGVNYIRFRSGTPTVPVVQSTTATLTLASQPQ